MYGRVLDGLVDKKGFAAGFTIFYFCFDLFGQTDIFAARFLKEMK